MKITKIAWSDKRKNTLVNFYAIEPDEKGHVAVMVPPFSWGSSQDAIAQINNERRIQGKPEYSGSILHVVFDQSSGRLYLPNMEDKSSFDLKPSLNAMLDAVKIKIEGLIDFIPLAAVVRGDPLETIRVRRVGDFFSVSDFIRRQSKDKLQHDKDIQLPVIEANMSKMPKTRKELFGTMENKPFMFVGSGKVVRFLVREETGAGPIDFEVHSQKGPFILVNIGVKTSEDGKPAVTAADKEVYVVSGYREYLASKNADVRNPKENVRLQSFKYLMYIGWSMKDVCLSTFRSTGTSNLADLLTTGSFLFNAAKSLKADGYKDPTENPYYYCFKIGKDFPISFTPQAGTDVYDYSRYHEILRVVYFDPETSYITIKTPLFLTQEIVSSVFKAKSQVFSAQYDPAEKAIKTSGGIAGMKEESLASVRALAKDVSNNANRPVKELSVKEGYLTKMRFERKHISDYPQAAEIIKDICKKLSAEPPKETRALAEGGIRFDDLEVVVGPWSKVGNTGAAGEYLVKGSKEPVKGFVVTSPAILIDDEGQTTAGERNDVIIHEYRHHINTQLWIELPSYDVSMNQGTTDKERVDKIVKYLTNTHERTAHKQQFKYLLTMGMTTEEVFNRVFPKKQRTIANIPISKEYASIIKEAEEELKVDRSVEEISENIQKFDPKKEVEDDGGDETDFFDPNDMSSLYN